MFHKDPFISQNITFRGESMFLPDIEANKERLLYRDKMKQISDRITFPNVIRIFITFNIVSLAWIFFRTAN
ncbi:MAG: hypothetical protein PHD11_09695, partial [Bacteroidales bacterium]|nr:hypothetical protein [Bacteroidales bacterium]